VLFSLYVNDMPVPSRHMELPCMRTIGHYIHVTQGSATRQVLRNLCE
jgi:hypothetical protein